jgi:hypothetical protein
MLAKIGKIKYLKHNPNRFHWDLSSITGSHFEKLIYDLILRALRDYRGVCKAIKTPNSGDRGKDIILSFKDQFQLFGIDFYHPQKRKGPGRLHVEIKKKNKGALSANEFGGSLLQCDADGVKPDYFLLVTSSYLSPNTAFHAQQEFSKEGIQFFILDKYRLAGILLGYDINALKKFSPLPSIDPVNVSYCLQSEDQIDEIWESSSKKFNSQKVFFLYLKIQNYDSKEHIVSVNLRSDINWGLTSIFNEELDIGDSNSLRLFIPAFGIKCKKLKLEQICFDAIDELRIAITIDDTHLSVKLSSHNLSFDFDPPLFGKQHNDLKVKILNELDDEDPVKLIDLHGFAGTGKSKLLEEVERLSVGTDKHFIIYEFRKENENNILSSILRRMIGHEHLDWTLESSISVKTFEEKLISLSQIIVYHYVLVLEDLHHASKGLLMFLKRYAAHKYGNNELRKISIIATGRNDSTFSNEDYYSFIDHVSQQLDRGEKNYKYRIFQATLKPWSDKDCIRFIKHTVIGVPNFVSERIMQLSENTPFGTIQSIQYLLDLNIVEIVNRNTVGVLNAEALSDKDFLPSGIKELLYLRTQNIARIHDDSIVSYLSALAYIGMESPTSVALQLMENEFDCNLIADLVERNFLVETDQGIKFCHENLQIYFLSFLQDRDLGKATADRLLKGADTHWQFSLHQKGYLFYISGDYPEAFHCFEDIWYKVSSLSVRNISSLDIPESYFDYFDPLINTAIRLRKDYKLIQEIGTIEVYTALHNKPLAKALEICDRNLKIVKKIDKQTDYPNPNIVKIEQLKAHILLNMGFVRPAQKIMHELSTRAKLDKNIANDSALMFDVYDRLQNIYHQLNHLEQFQQYSDLSRCVAKKIGNKKMLSLVRSSRVKEYYYNNPEKFYDKTKQATKNALANASKRHICHAELNLCIAELIAFCQYKNRIKAIIEALHKNLTCATENGYSFSITRAQLGIATAYCLLGLDNPNNFMNAERYTDFGIESGLRYGNGFFHWQLHNLKAIIEMNRPNSDTQLTAGHFETALHFLNKQGLLFIGSLDSLSPNLSVISNIINFYDTHMGDKITYNFVKNLGYYDKGMKNEKEEVVNLIKNLRKYKLIGREQRLPLPFIEPSTGYLLAVR